MAAGRTLNGEEPMKSIKDISLINLVERLRDVESLIAVIHNVDKKSECQRGIDRIIEQARIELLDITELITETSEYIEDQTTTENL